MVIRNIVRYLLNYRAKRKISAFVKKTVKNRYRNIDCTKKVKGESDYLSKWADLMIRKDPYYYRLYTNVSGMKSPNHLPDDVYVIYILKLLNDSIKDNPFKDKNFYDLLFSGDCFPKTYFRNMQGIYLDSNYSPIANVDIYIDELLKIHDSLVVKPTLDTSGGKNVRLFKKKSNKFKDKQGKILCSGYLDHNYGSDFIIQQTIKTSNDLSLFKTGSVNSMRIFVYRSVVDNKIKILNTYLKVGAKGSFTDNISGNGFAIRVCDNGKLDEFAVNKNGEKIKEINGVDLRNNLYIESFENVKAEVKNVAEKYIYDRFIGFDVTKDVQNKPVILESNLGHVGVTLFSTLGYPIFGEYTNEIIDYCVRHKQKLEKKYSIKI